MRYIHLGEGGYAKTEQMIRNLLVEADSDFLDKNKLYWMTTNLTLDSYAWATRLLGSFTSVIHVGKLNFFGVSWLCPNRLNITRTK